MESPETIIEAANRLLRDHPEYDGSGLSTNDFYYFSKSELLEKKGQGPKTTYAPGTAERVVFIELLRRNHKLSIPAIKMALRDVDRFVDSETIARVAKGEEELILLGFSPQGRAEARPGRSLHSVPAGESPADYLRQARNKFKPEVKETESFQRVPLTKNVELNIRGSLTPDQLRQLAIIGELIKTILDPEGR